MTPAPFELMIRSPARPRGERRDARAPAASRARANDARACERRVRERVRRSRAWAGAGESARAARERERAGECGGQRPGRGCPLEGRRRRER